MRPLHSGDQNPYVPFAQQRLNALDFGPVDPTGVMDDATVDAVRTLQEERGLPVSGVVDSDTWLELLGTRPSSGGGPLSFGQAEEPATPLGDDFGDGAGDFVTIHPGEAGPALGAAQLRLRALGHEVATEDVLGPSTAAAVIAFAEGAGWVSDDGTLDYQTVLDLQLATAHVEDLLQYATDEELADQFDANMPLSFAGDEYRDVVGKGGYEYRQYADGAVEITKSPRSSKPRTFYEGSVWQAITDEIGPYPEVDVPDGFEPVARGSRGERARWVQARLNELGFGPLAVDGIFGRGSGQGVQRFQAAAGLPTSGAVDADTWTRLEDPWPELALGATDDAVFHCQEKLKALGHVVEVTGVYDAITVEAVKSFQVKLRLAKTGVLDGITRGHLEAARAVGVPSPLVMAERARLKGIAAEQVQALPEEVRALVLDALTQACEMYGVAEEPAKSNAGPGLQAMWNVVNAGVPGYPWCAAAISAWLLWATGAKTWKQSPFGRSNMHALTFGKKGEQRGWFVSAAGGAPAPVGSVFVMYRGGSGSDSAGPRPQGQGRWEGAGHTGIVLRDDGDRILSIDGNVSDRCWTKNHRKSKLIGYIKWWEG